MNLEMTNRNCPVCGSSDESHVFAESNVDLSKLDAFAFASRKFPEYMHWRLIECQNCDLLYATPAPTPESLNVAYDAAAFDSGPEAKYAALTYARFLPGIKRKLADANGALDIGTGDGAFLQHLLDASPPGDAVERLTRPAQRLGGNQQVRGGARLSHRLSRFDQDAPMARIDCELAHRGHKRS